MKQLGVLDAAFVNLEHPNTPQHIGGLGIYDPSTAPGGFVRFKGVISNFEQRLLKQPMFRSRLVHSPGDFDRPYWVQDANFDVEFHIRHIALPQPGDWRQLCILVSRIHARPLDMSRPLWEAYIIEGLDNIPDVPKGAFAIYTKMHHSLVDGAGGASFMSVIHDLEAEPKATDQAQQAILVDSAPSPVYLAANAAVNQAKNSVKLARDTLGLVKDLGRFALGIARKQIPMPSIQAPRTRFNKPVSPYRVFDAAEFPLEEIKMIKNAVGGKVNDVVLTIVSGAMRRYLDHYNELPEESLAAGIPLNMRTRRGETTDNNQVGSVFMELHTNIKDPIERLHAIQKSAQEAKEFGEASPLVDVLKVAGTFAPALTRPVVNMYVNNHMSRHLPLNISTVISNVAGPPFPLYSAGARMVRYYGIGLLTPGVGLFHLAFTSDGIMTLAALADRETMPDPSFYRECLYVGFEELREAAIRHMQQRESTAEETAAKPAKRSRKASAAAPVTPTPAKKVTPPAKHAPAKRRVAKAGASGGLGKKPAARKPAAKAAAATPAADTGTAKPKAAAKRVKTVKRAEPKAPVKKAKAAAGDAVTSILAPVPGYEAAVAERTIAGGNIVTLTKKSGEQG